MGRKTEEERREHNRLKTRKWNRDHPGYSVALHNRRKQKDPHRFAKLNAEWRRQAYALRKAWLSQYKASHGCICCGERTPICLQFHHLNASDKTDDLSVAGSGIWRMAKIQKEIAKCIILCANCHAKLHGLDRDA